MGQKKGQVEYLKFKAGKILTYKEAIKAHCFACNGEGDGGGEDCKGKSCPLYYYFKQWIWEKRESKWV